MAESIFLLLPDDLEEAVDSLTLLSIQHDLWVKDSLRKNFVFEVGKIYFHILFHPSDKGAFSPDCNMSYPCPCHYFSDFVRKVAYIYCLCTRQCWDCNFYLNTSVTH